jgi:hypothetical protein
MPRVVAVPYRLPDRSEVKAGQWQTVSGGEWGELPEALESWDYSTALQLRRSISVDTTTVIQVCGLPDGTPLAVCAVWHATATGRRGSLAARTVEADLVDLQATLQGTELGGQLHLHTTVVLVEDTVRTDPLAPWRAGTVLWRDSVTVHLEGTAALFPTELSDFAAMGLPAAAGWYLEIAQAEPASATLGALRLFLNEANTGVRRALEAPNGDAVAGTVISAIRYDVMRQLIEAALDNEDLVEGSEYPPGTMGASMSTAVRLAFGSDNFAAIRSLRRTVRSEYEVRIQNAAGVFAQ